jgi:phage tail sheath protein FI
MTTYNKPGVYVEETLTPNAPVAPTLADSVVAFIGVADRGPTSVSAGNVLATPTLVNSWTEFATAFGYGTSIDPFKAVGIGTAADDLKYAVKTFFLNGGGQAYISRVVNTDAVKASISFRDSNATISTAVPTLSATSTGSSASAATEITLVSATGVVAGMGVTGTNVGAGAVITNVVATTSTITVSVANSGAVSSATALTLTGWTIDGSGAASNVLTISASSGAPFEGIEAGRTVLISGITAGSYTGLNNKYWVVSNVSTDNNTLSILWKNENPIAAVAQTTAITVRGSIRNASSTTPTLVVTAKDHGAWGNSLWAAVTPSSVQGYFDLNIYFSLTASVSSSLTDADRVESFTQLSMNSTDSRYVVTTVQSNWVTVSDGGSTASGLADLPAFTGYWSTSDTSNNANPDTAEFQWNNANFSNTVTSTSGGTAVLTAAKLGVSGSSQVTISGVAGSNGSAAPVVSSQILPGFDSITTPLLINYPAKTDTATINSLLSYAATRQNGFVIIDAANTTVSSLLSTTTDVGIGSYVTNRNYGAAYYPNIVVPDYASSTGATKSIAPGGAVAATYVSTDQARGVFKAPAGTLATIAPAVSITALTNDDFNAISGYGNANLNIIRFVPGAGICIMGARTLSSSFSDIYVPVRRSLNYLNYALKNVTEFAVFEPNDSNLWNDVTGVIESLLYDFWREGGLVGTTSEEAYYIKCDAQTNTSASISAGELRIEVGVALQRPAEFVVIKLGQTSGGTTITNSI